MSTTSPPRADADRGPGQTEADGISRRSVLTRSAAGVGIALAGDFGGLFGAGASPANAAAPASRTRGAGYGPLVDDPAGLLSVPAGFSYTIVAQSGVTRLDSGEPTPSDPDGTACFVRHAGKGSVLICNHEIGGGEPYPVPSTPGFVYEPAGPRVRDHRPVQEGALTRTARSRRGPTTRRRARRRWRLIRPSGRRRRRMAGASGSSSAFSHEVHSRSQRGRHDDAGAATGPTSAPDTQHARSVRPAAATLAPLRVGGPTR